MKDIIKEITEYRNKIYDYFESEDFKKYVASVANDYFMEKYFETFKRYCLGGKCVRGYLVSLGYQLAGKTSSDDVFFASIAYEIFETSVLAHDDIVDQSPLRRGIPSMYLSLGNGELGKARALTVADTGFFISEHILKNLKLSNKLILECITLQNEIFIKTCCGQLKDIDLSNLTSYTEADVLKMYEMKTAYYTIIGPLMLGATLAGASKSVLENIKQIGLNLGLLFQTKDDVIGIFGDEKVIGKSNMSDIVEGKKTILTSHFIANADAKDLQIFKKVYGTNKKHASQIVKELFVKTSTLNYANKKCSEFYENAKKLIKQSDFEKNSKLKLLEFSKYIFEREK